MNTQHMISTKTNHDTIGIYHASRPSCGRHSYLMKKTTISFLIIIATLLVNAQNEITWNFSAKKISDKKYEIHLTPALQSPWHIYSQTSPEAGALPTKIVFNKNPLVSIEGKVKEVGKVVSKYEEVFGVTVKYFEGQADFVQEIRLKASAKTNLSGSIEFMACNDEQCLAPKTIQFSIPIQ
jgi:hypothetical protein